MSIKDLRSTLQEYDQEHLLQFWNEISHEEQQHLINDIRNLNMKEIISNFQRAKMLSDNKKNFVNKMKPISLGTIEFRKNLSLEKFHFYESLGLEEIAKGKVAVVLLAGGQGTRLGVDFPKGMYNVNLPSKRTLFHLQALKIKRLQNLAKDKYEFSKGISWYIMTSDATHEQTLLYFENNAYFGLDKNNVLVFKQNTLPCFAANGKIILDEKYRISKAPDGNGGLYKALKQEGILEDMRQRGINSVHVFSVDNILVKVADPLFLGYCISRSADCGVKVVPKRFATEPVGVVCQVDGLYTVVEYSEISSDTVNLQNEEGSLIFNAGNICNHYFTTKFLLDISEKYEDNLELHIATKKIPFIDSNGIKCKPNISNGIKIEKFIFDVFKYSKNFVVWEVLREDEFSPLKNSDSAKVDCPETARNDILNLHKKWILNAGACKVEGAIEICPLISYDGENLSHLVKNKSLIGPICLT